MRGCWYFVANRLAFTLGSQLHSDLVLTDEAPSYFYFRGFTLLARLYNAGKLSAELQYELLLYSAKACLFQARVVFFVLACFVLACVEGLRVIRGANPVCGRVLGIFWIRVVGVHATLVVMGG